MASRWGPWRGFDTFLLTLGVIMAIVATVCWFTVFPRAYPDPKRHGGRYPVYEPAECRLHDYPDYPDSHENEDHDVECGRNDRNEWCDADDPHRGLRGIRFKRSWRGRHSHRRFPCIKVRVIFFFRGRNLEGILYESWLEVENFQRCSTSSCLADRRENERKVRKWRDQLGRSFPCYVNRHKMDDVVLKKDDFYCLASKPGFHAVLWPALIAAVCFFWLMMRCICICCCRSSIRSDPKVKPGVDRVFVPEKQAGPLPDKKALENGGEVILVPPFGPPPTYDGHYKEADTVSMMSAPPEYDVTKPPEVAVAKVDT